MADDDMWAEDRDVWTKRDVGAYGAQASATKKTPAEYKTTYNTYTPSYNHYGSYGHGGQSYGGHAGYNNKW